MPNVHGEYQLNMLDLKAGSSQTVFQVVAPQFRGIKLNSFRLGFPNYELPPGSPSLGTIEVSVERQTGGKFANGAHLPLRVKGSDRAGEPLDARYRTVVIEEPKTTEVLEAYELDVVSAGAFNSEGQLAPIDIPPGGIVGIRITPHNNVRIWYFAAQHEE